MHSPQLHSCELSILALALAGTMTGCGGGTGSGNGPAATDGGQGSAQGTAVGTVTGFGSVIVDGVRFDDSRAKVETEQLPGTTTPLRTSDLRIGQRTTVQFTGDSANPSATSISVDPEITGKVDQVDAATGRLVVAGQDVRINTDPAKGPVTAFDGFRTTADIKPGDRVEVHGLAQTDPTTQKWFVQATRIEHKGADQVFVRVAGPIANLAASTFDLGTLKVSFDASTRRIPANATLANGTTVVVWSDQPVTASTVSAKAIRLRGNLQANTAWLGGTITDCTGACIANFRVDGLAVDASRAKFDHGAATALVNGVFVRVRGTVDPATGKVLATEVRFRDETANELDVRGTITGLAAGAGGASTFSVRGVAVQTGAQTRTAGCPVPLVDGVPVRVEGAVAGNVLAAASVQCLPSLDSVKAEVRGRISQTDANAKTFALDSLPDMTIRFDPASTKFEHGAAAQLVVGAFVSVEGTATAKSLDATEIEFRQAPGAGERHVEGIVFGYDPATLQFNVGTLTVKVGGAALPAGFANGVRVEVHYLTAGGVNTASRIEVRKNG